MKKTPFPQSVVVPVEPTLPLHFDSVRIATVLRAEAERLGKRVPSDLPGIHKDLWTAAEIIDMAEEANAFPHKMSAMLAPAPAPSSLAGGESIDALDQELIDRGLRTVRAYDAVRFLRDALSATITRLTGYDWNSDPDGLTTQQGDALALADKVFADLSAAVDVHPDIELPECHSCGGTGKIEEAARTQGANQHSACIRTCDDCDGCGFAPDEESDAILAALSPEAPARDGVALNSATPSLKAVSIITTVHAPADKRHPVPLNQLPSILLEAHNALTAMPEGFGEDGEFRLLKASVLENGDVSLVSELGAPAPTTRETADHAELARLAEDKANAHIRNLRLAAGRDFAVSGYSDGLIVEQDMRGMLLAAAEAFDALLSEIAALRDYGRDAAKEALEYRRQRDELRKALETIGEMAPSTCETSLAHDMAQFASQALTEIDK